MANMSGDSNVQEMFSTLEMDTIGEIMNISMGSAATAASTLLDNKTNITTPVVTIVPIEEFSIAELEPAVAVEIQYVEGISGSNILVLKQEDVRAILSQMMMTELPEDFKIDEMAESAICELMNQMMGSSATVLSCFLGRNINISTPRVVPIDELDEFKKRHFDGDSAVISIEFHLTIQDSIDSVFMCAMKPDLAKEIIDVSLNFDSGEGLEAEPKADEPPAAAEPAPSPAPPPAAAAAAPPPPPQQAAAPPPPAAAQVPPVQAPPPPQQPAYAPPPPGYDYQQYPPQQAPYPYPPQQMPGYPPQAAYAQQPIMVKDYNYGDFSQGGQGDRVDPLNIDLVMNVPVVMTVELGRTKRKIKEILEFGQGTIVELDKQAGSHVDVIVNGQLIAYGDVVVVDDNFSIRITEIIKNRDPLSML